MLNKLSEDAPVPYKEIGRRLKKARKINGLTQEQLARVVGMSRTSISNIEAGIQGMSVETLYALADAIGKEPGDLLPPRPKLLQEEVVRVISNAKDIRHEPKDVKSWVTAFVPQVQEDTNSGSTSHTSGQQSEADIERRTHPGIPRRR